MNDQHQQFSQRLIDAGVWDAQRTIQKAQAAGLDFEQMNHIADYWEEDGTGVGTLVYRLTNSQPQSSTPKVEAAAPARRDENIYWCPKYGHDTPHDPSNAEHVAAWEKLRADNGF